MNRENKANDTSLMAQTQSPSSSNEFIPTDEQLLGFLDDKVNGKSLPNDVPIVEYDLYGDRNPWEIWEAFGGTSGRDLYFFTTLKKKTRSRFDRTIGSGSWENSDGGTWVFDEGTNQLLGFQKYFRFRNSGTVHDGAWIMHEYSLHSSANNYVVCRLRKNLKDVQRRKSQKRTGQTSQSSNTALGLAATTAPADEHVGLGEDIHESPGKGSRNEQVQPEEDSKEEEEEIEMFPNTFFKEMVEQWGSHV